MISVPKVKRSARILAWGSCAGLLWYLVAAWLDRYDAVYIVLYQRDHQIVAALIGIPRHLFGPAIMALAGGIMAIPVAVYALFPPKGWVRRSLVGVAILCVLGCASVVWRAQDKPEQAPNPNWVEANRRGPEGSEFRTFYSKTVDGDVSYLIYLPEHYEDSPQRRYPVVYHLPGGSGKQMDVQHFLRRYKAVAQEGGAAPMIVVGVNCGGEGSTYRDPPVGLLPMESIIVKDLIPHIDATYRTVHRPAGRALEGGSWGGFGALHLSFKYPEIFGVVWSAAPALTLPGRDDSPWRFGELNAEVVKRTRMQIRLVCGTKDPYFRVTKAFHGMLQHLHIPNSYSEVSGADHSGLDVRLSDEEVIGFFSEAFKGLTD